MTGSESRTRHEKFRDTGDAPCPLCDRGQLLPAFPTVPGFRVSTCSSCGIALTLPVLTAEEMSRYYPAEYYGKSNQRFHPVMERLVAAFRRARVRKIERLTSGPGRVLDIGCGRGLTLTYLRQDGWEPFGVELSDTASAHARKLLGDAAIHTGPLSCVPWPRSSFKAVILWHVLEHLADPKGTLALCREFLEPGGLLAVAVPNFESLQSRATGGHWFHLDTPRHYWHFGSKTLKRLLDEHGFTVIDESHVSLEQNPYGWLQSLLNLAGFPCNLLYDILKHGSARDLPQPVRTHPVASTLLLPALLLAVPAALALSALESLLGRGGTIELYAVRRD